jgi:uncharacterized protein (DUF2141 family)
MDSCQFLPKWIRNRSLSVTQKALFGALALVLMGAGTAGQAAMAADDAGEQSAPAQLDAVQQLKSVHMASGRELDKIAQYVRVDKPLGWCDDEATNDHIRLTIPNIKEVVGNIRMSLYGDQKKEWLAGGKKLVRFDIPVTASEMVICMPMPRGPGQYGVGIYHDEDADKKFDFLSEGYGVSNNAKRRLFGKPAFKKAVFTAVAGRNDLIIRVRY